MKFFCAASVIVLLLVGSGRCHSQGFLNLNFEQATVVPISGGDYGPYSIAVTDALPSWSVYYGANQQSQMTYNDPALGSTFVTLYATNGEQLAGNYSVLLQGGGTYSSATISQTGFVPDNAQSLTFIALGDTTLGASGLQVSLGGEQLSFFAISNELNYTLYGASIAPFAGQTEALSFSAVEDQDGYNNWEIDNIQFSTSPVPEPSTLALCALCGLLLRGGGKNRRHKIL